MLKCDVMREGRGGILQRQGLVGSLGWRSEGRGGVLQRQGLLVGGLG